MIVAHVQADSLLAVDRDLRLPQEKSCPTLHVEKWEMVVDQGG